MVAKKWVLKNGNFENSCSNNSNLGTLQPKQLETFALWPAKLPLRIAHVNAGLRNSVPAIRIEKIKNVPAAPPPSTSVLCVVPRKRTQARPHANWRLSSILRNQLWIGISMKLERETNAVEQCRMNSTIGKKIGRISDCRWLLHKFSRSGLERILLCDEKWVVYDNRKAKNQWLGPGQVGDRTPRSDPHQKKVMLTIWWMASGPGILGAASTWPNHNLWGLLRATRPRAGRASSSWHQSGPSMLSACNTKPHTSRRTLAKLDELGWDVFKAFPL